MKVLSAADQVLNAAAPDRADAFYAPGFTWHDAPDDCRSQGGTATVARAAAAHAGRRVVDHTSLQSMPDWATPIPTAAFDLAARIATVAALTTAARYRHDLPGSPATLRGAGR